MPTADLPPLQVALRLLWAVSSAGKVTFGAWALSFLQHQHKYKGRDAAGAEVTGSTQAPVALPKAPPNPWVGNKGMLLHMFGYWTT